MIHSLRSIPMGTGTIFTAGSSTQADGAETGSPQQKRSGSTSDGQARLNPVVPLHLGITLWSGPPHHPITCLLIGSDNATIMTGSRTGQLILWRVNWRQDPKSTYGSTPTCSPFSLCFGHTEPVSALCNMTMDGRAHVVSVCRGGQLFLWRNCDGMCKARLAQPLTWAPLAVLCVMHRRQKLVAVSGEHSEIVLVDVRRGAVVLKLSGHATWVPFLLAVNPSQIEQTSGFFSIDAHSRLSQWDLSRTTSARPSTVLGSAPQPAAAAATASAHKPVGTATLAVKGSYGLHSYGQWTRRRWLSKVDRCVLWTRPST